VRADPDHRFFSDLHQFHTLVGAKEIWQKAESAVTKIGFLRKCQIHAMLDPHIDSALDEEEDYYRYVVVSNRAYNDSTYSVRSVLSVTLVKRLKSLGDQTVEGIEND
jgi:hypothetical protein